MNSLNTTLLITLQNLTEVGVIATDEKGLIQFFNKGAKQLLGYHPDTVLSTPLSPLLYSHPETKSLNGLQRVLSSHPAGRQVPYTFIHQTRQPVPVELQVQPYVQETGSPGGYILTFTLANPDHTSAESIAIRSKNKRQESEERFSQLIEGIRDAMFVYPYFPDQMPGTFTSVNEIACQMLGYSREELLTLSPLMLNAPDMKKQAVKQATNLFKNKRAVFENIVITKDGRRIPVEISTTILEVEGVPTGIALMRDISRRKQAVEEVQGIQAAFKAIFEESPIGMAIADETGRLIQINQSYCCMMGYQKEELLHMHFSDITHPDDLQANIEVRDRVLKGEINSYQLEKKYITKNKDYIWARLTGIGFKQNHSTFIAGIAEDITERKKAELILQENERRLQEAEKNANLGSWELDILTGEINLSKQFFSIYEITDEADKIPFYTTRMYGFTFAHPDDRSYVEKNIEEFINGYNDSDFEHRLITKSGKVVHVHVTSTFSFDKEGKPVKISGTIQDITDRKRREEELLRAKQQAEEVALAKQQFLSTMSHELRTPMNAVIGLTHLLLQEDPLPDQIENLQMLKFSSENLLALINDILDFSKIEAGKINLENVNFSVRSLVVSIINSLQLKANEKGIVLVMRIDEQIPQLVAGDPVRLTQVLNNLLSNAIKFTEKGSVTLSIVLEESLPEYKQLHFSVTDTGIGIPADKLTHIFESFSQAGNDITRKYGGTGLGLAITKRLLELQDSTIHVESKLGEGSIFYFSLKVGSTIAGPEKLSLYTKAAQVITLDSLRLLLVEDNEINQMIATKFLTKWHIYPDYANNGLEAVEKVKQKQYDVILMDLQMPEMNGYEATRTIRSLDEERFRQIPIIALTADAVMDVKERALAAGMSDFITKPFDPDDLYQKLVRYINRPHEEIQSGSPHPLQANGTKTLLSYKQVYELASGDMIFVEQLIQSSIEQIQQFKGVIHEIVEAKNKSRFDSAVHKIQPMIRLFEMNMLAQHLQETRTLMENSSVSFEHLNNKIIELMRDCNALTEKLAQPQHQS